MKVQLIFSRSDFGVGQGLDLEEKMQTKVNAGGGLLYLCSQIRGEPELEVEVFCEEYTPKDEILRRLNGNVVGVSTWFSNYRNGLTYLKAAKEKGMITVIGGHQVNGLGRRVFANNGFIDYAILGYGERPFLQLIRHIKSTHPSLSQIPGLMYRDGEIKTNGISWEIDLDGLPLIDLENLVDRNVFIESANANRGFMSFTASRGCSKVAKNEKCRFCSVLQKGPITMSPYKVFEQIRTLSKLYGFHTFFVSSEDMFFPHYLDALLSSRPKDLDFSLYCGASLENITPENAAKLKKLSVDVVLVGLETFDQEVMRKMGKVRKKHGRSN